MAKIQDYATVTTLNEGMVFFTGIDTDSNGSFESRKVALASLRSRLLQSPVVDSATAIAHDYDTLNTMSTSGWRLAAWRNNGSIVSYIDSSGQFSKTIGIQEKYVSHKLMSLPTTNPAGAAAGVETTAGRPDYWGFPFDGGATNENVEFEIALPKKWARGTFTAQFYWTSTATDTDAVIWGIQAVAVSDSDTIDVVYGTAVEVTDNAISAAEDLYISSETGEVTIAGSPADADLVYFRVFRNSASASDTHAEDAVLIGVKLRFTMDAASDD